MKSNIFIIVILTILNYTLNAQTTITGVVSDSLNKPIPFASVYLSKTTIGTLTDKDGLYSFTIQQDGVYEMISSSIGFKSNSLIISSEGKKQTINIKLSIDLILLDEVTVKSKDKNRLKNYTLFSKLFLGETVNSQYCKILNPEDLHLYRDSQTDILKGFSIKPLRIENKSLGYTIIYDLADFIFDPKIGFLRFTGNLLFQPLKGNARNNEKWTHNRLTCYYGSRLHLLRAIHSASLDKENFKIYECELDSATKECLETKPIQEKNICFNHNTNSINVFSPNPILISYTDNHPELATGLLGFQSQKYESTIQFSDTLKVFRNGYFDNPYAITWGGEMGIERIADMLPFDYLPHTINDDSDSELAESPLEEYLTYQQKSTSKDQVFVHLDRNIYKPGDTIFFQAYVRDRFTGNFESRSVALYVLLFNEKKIMIDSSRFKINNFTSSGWMAIPIKAEVGKYHFVAFTGMMQNFDPADAFQLDLHVKELNNNSDKIKITFNKEKYKPGDTLEANIKITDSKGNPLNQQKFQYSFASANYSEESEETLTNKKGESLIRFTIPDTILYQPRFKVIANQISDKISLIKEVNIPFEDQYLELRFLPEGGTFIEGLQQRIGFNATNYKGEPVYIEGLLKTSSGSILDTIKSGIYGPGCFSCIAQKGLYVEIIKGAGAEKNWPLPDPTAEGISLSILPVNNRSFAVEIQSNNYSNESLTLSGTMNMTQVFFQELMLNKKQHIVVETNQLPSGIATITLFNKDLRPIAERLFYVNADKQLKLKIQTENKIYHPGQETELTISLADGQGNPTEGIFSIAVTDSIKGFDSELFVPGIEYTFNYQTYFPGNLPPKVLVKGLENITNEERDLLLLVYGWTKYNWDFTQKNTNDKQIANYDLLNMRILYALKIHRNDRSLDLISLEGPSIKHLMTNNLGEISLPLDSLPEITRSVTLMPDVRTKNRVLGAMLNIPYNEQYFKSNKLFNLQPTIPTEEYSISLPYQNISLGEKIIEIPEVTIIGHRGDKKEYHDKYEEMYQYANVRSLDYNLLWSSPSFDNALYRLTFPIITPDAVYFRNSTSFKGGNTPALIVLDGMPLYSGGYSIVKTILPSEMTSLTVLKGPQGFYKYGEAGKGGVIFVNTRTNDPAIMKLRNKWILQNKKDNMLLPINIYRSNIEFYTPTKHDMDIDPMLQNRSTIFWNSEIYFDGKTPVKIKYTNLKHQSPVIITINAVSANNLIGTGRTSYQVHDGDK